MNLARHRYFVEKGYFVSPTLEHEHEVYLKPRVIYTPRTFKCFKKGQMKKPNTQNKKDVQMMTYEEEGNKLVFVPTQQIYNFI